MYRGTGKVLQRLVTVVSGLIIFSIAGQVAAMSCLKPPTDMMGWWPGDGNAKDIQIIKQVDPPSRGKDIQNAFLKGLNNNVTAPILSGGLDVNHNNDNYDAATSLYYSQVDSSSLRDTLTKFKTANSFNGVGEIHAVYANSGDLGFGRDMHCKRVENPVSSGLYDVACYVNNHGTGYIGSRYGSPDAEDFIHTAKQISPVATVAMEYSRINPSNLSSSRIVKFYVYDANGNQVNNADLDGNGPRPVPQLCTICHAGKVTATFDGGGNATGVSLNTDSVFLPFDFSAFSFLDGITAQSVPGKFDKVNQQSAFRRLNQEIVLSTIPTASLSSSPIAEMIDHMYLPVGGLGTGSQVENFVVPGWNNSTLEKMMYQTVIARSCRGCHISQTGTTGLTFQTAAQAKLYANAIEFYLCQQPLGAGAIMPHARATFDRFWASGTNIAQPDVLKIWGNSFGQIFSCGSVSPPAPPNNGVLFNAATFAPGKVGQAFSFNSLTDDYIDITDANKAVSSLNDATLDFGTNSFSVDAWINLSDTAGDRTIASKQEDPPDALLGLLTYKGWRFGTKNGNLTFFFGSIANYVGPTAREITVTGAPLSTNTWYHVAAVVDRTEQEVRLYINGTEYSASNANVSIIGGGFSVDDVDTSATLRIGNVHPNTASSFGGPFAGMIDEVEIFNRELDSSEIAAIFTADSFGQCKGASTDSDNDGLMDDFEAGFGGNINVINSNSSNLSSSGSSAEGSIITSGDTKITFPPGTTTTGLNITINPPSIAISGANLPAGTTKTIQIPIFGGATVCINDAPTALIQSVSGSGCSFTSISIPAVGGLPQTFGAYTVSRISNTHVQIDGLLHSAVSTMPLPTFVSLVAFDASVNASSEVLVHWATDLEVDHYGFELLREDKASGIREVVFTQSGGLGSTGGDYFFIDKAIVAGNDYSYTLVDIDTSGQRTEHGPLTVSVVSGQSFTFDPETNVTAVAVNHVITPATGNGGGALSFLGLLALLVFMPVMGHRRQR